MQHEKTIFCAASADVLPSADSTTVKNECEANDGCTALVDALVLLSGCLGLWVELDYAHTEYYASRRCLDRKRHADQRVRRSRVFRIFPIVERRIRPLHRSGHAEWRDAHCNWQLTIHRLQLQLHGNGRGDDDRS